MYRQLTPLIELLDPDIWPEEFFQNEDLQGLLESVYVVDSSFSSTYPSINVSIKALLQGQILFTIPGLAGTSLVIGVPTVEIIYPPVDEDPILTESESVGLDPNFPYDTGLPEN